MDHSKIMKINLILNAMLWNFNPESDFQILSHSMRFFSQHLRTYNLSHNKADSFDKPMSKTRQNRQEIRMNLMFSIRGF